MAVVHVHKPTAVLQAEEARTDLAVQVEVVVAIVRQVVRLEVRVVTEVQGAHPVRIPVEGLLEEEGHPEDDLQEVVQEVAEDVNKLRKFR